MRERMLSVCGIVVPFGVLMEASRKLNRVLWVVAVLLCHIVFWDDSSIIAKLVQFSPSPNCLRSVLLIVASPANPPTSHLSRMASEWREFRKRHSAVSGTTTAAETD